MTRRITAPTTEAKTDSPAKRRPVLQPQLPLAARPDRTDDDGFDPNDWRLDARTKEVDRRGIALGLSQYGKKMLPEAEASFRKSIELVPGKSRQHFALGQIYEDEGRLGDARKEYIAEIRIDPKSQDAQERLREIDARMMRGGGAEKP